jgi:hypothetical protein
MELWRQIVDYAEHAVLRAGHAFVDTHMLMIEAAAGDRAAIRLHSRLSPRETRRRGPLAA